MLVNEGACVRAAYFRYLLKRIKDKTPHSLYIPDKTSFRNLTLKKINICSL